MRTGHRAHTATNKQTKKKLAADAPRECGSTNVLLTTAADE